MPKTTRTLSLLGYAALLLLSATSLTAAQMLEPTTPPDPPKFDAQGTPNFVGVKDMFEYRALPEYHEPAWVTEKFVSTGKLPPVAERLPKEPLVYRTSRCGGSPGRQNDHCCTKADGDGASHPHYICRWPVWRSGARARGGSGPSRQADLGGRLATLVAIAPGVNFSYRPAYNLYSGANQEYREGAHPLELRNEPVAHSRLPVAPSDLRWIYSATIRGQW